MLEVCCPVTFNNPSIVRDFLQEAPSRRGQRKFENY
jgi:hypothetical protein